ADRLAAARAVVERPVVDVHADELVRKVMIEITAVLQGILHRFSAMIEAVLDRLFKDVSHFLHGFTAEVTSDAVASQRQGEAGFFMPPDPQIAYQMQAGVFVGE